MIKIEESSFLKYFEESLGVEAISTGNVLGGLFFREVDFDREKITGIVQVYFGEKGYRVDKEDVASYLDSGLVFSITKSGEKRILVTVGYDSGELLVICG